MQISKACRSAWELRFPFNIFALCLLLNGFPQHVVADETQSKRDSEKKELRFTTKVRASEIDAQAKAHPEIDFVFEKDGKAVDYQVASVAKNVQTSGKLVVWLMGHNEELFQRLNSYGHHAIQIHYANGWFSKLNKEPPPDDQYLGRIRLEAAIGEDISDAIEIPFPDSIAGRTASFLHWLEKEHPEGNWAQFLTDQGQVNWDKVILAGISHGSTTAARFALHQKVARVVMLSGPRDQLENWYSLPSVTPKDRFYAFTHELDAGWTRGHYPRSWKLLGLEDLGPIVNVDEYLQGQTVNPSSAKSSEPKFNGSHQLISSANVDQDVNRAHSASVPGKAAIKDEQGRYIHESVWRYLFAD